MVTLEEIRQLSRLEKLQAMEIIWSDLTGDGGDVASPRWHEDVLNETGKRVSSGAETAIDWDAAKQRLRSKRK